MQLFVSYQMKMGRKIKYCGRQMSSRLSHLLFAQKLGTFGDVFALFAVECFALLHFGGNLFG